MWCFHDWYYFSRVPRDFHEEKQTPTLLKAGQYCGCLKCLKIEWVDADGCTRKSTRKHRVFQEGRDGGLRIVKYSIIPEYVQEHFAHLVNSIQEAKELKSKGNLSIAQSEGGTVAIVDTPAKLSTGGTDHGN